MLFKTLTVEHWQQFELINISLDSQVTIITGTNGSGKTTLLKILSTYSGWTSQSISTPKKDKKTGIFKFLNRFFDGEDISNSLNIGKITYSDNMVSEINIPHSASAQYNLEISNKKHVSCFYIPSHRSVFRYQPLGSIPAAKKDKAAAFNEVANANKQRYQGSSSPVSSFSMKSTLISWVINGYGVKGSTNQYIMPSDREQIENFEGFQIILKKLLPKNINFDKIEIRKMEVVFVCNNGKDEFLLETASGGISALIDIAWQIYMYSQKESHVFSVIIDEIENHLHPVMQRTILQDLVNAFPSVKFIVSTHSPLIVSSVKNSSVYALLYNENKKITSKKLDLMRKAKTSTEILDEVLGVSFTMPVWAENELKQIISKYGKVKLDEEHFKKIREDLKSIGLERMMPYAIHELMESRS